MVSPTPFTLRVADDALADLKSRLARTRWPDEPPLEPWASGTSVGYLRGLVEYWKDGFEWRDQERALNRFRQFTVVLPHLGDSGALAGAPRSGDAEVRSTKPRLRPPLAGEGMVSSGIDLHFIHEPGVGPSPLP